jgi:hypothetical protein
MPNLLFVNKDALSLGSSTNTREKGLIQAHVQAKRPHMSRRKGPIIFASTRPKYLEFRHNDNIEVEGSSTKLSTKPSEECGDQYPSQSKHMEDEQLLLQRLQAQRYNVSNYTLNKNDWTADLVSLRGENMVEVRLHSESDLPWRGTTVLSNS